VVAPSEFQVHRVYDEEPPADDGYRVLVDRLWPRGVSKQRAALDEWAKDVAPSDGLRRWYGHEPAKFSDFARRYRAELALTPGKDAVDRLRAMAEKSPVILVTATRDVERSGATVLLDVLTGHPTSPR
jgi:uncharacterized protein YeaO (DUF488 family)